ncbi:MAG: thioredoxin family protein [Thermodesulfobacteriota bacterium]
MDTVTYPDSRIVAFVSEFMIAVRANVSTSRLAVDFGVRQTPTVVVTDGQGKEHHQAVGFQPPEELLPALLFGIGKALMAVRRFSLARPKFDGILAGYPTSRLAPEARKLRDFCRQRAVE